MKTLSVFPMQEELDFFLQGCVEQGLAAQTSQIGRIPVIHLPRLGMTLAVGGLGKAQFAVQTQHLIDCGLDWNAVLCIGAAGALDDELTVGDVVVGTETIEYDIRNRFGEPLLPRFSSDTALLEEFRRIKLKTTAFRIHFGAIASGDEDIVEMARRVQVRELTGALANAWEGAGGARASYFSRMPFIEIRGISDGANETAALDFEANLPSTMRNLAIVVAEWAGRFSIAD